MKKIKFYILLFIINNLLKGTRLFVIKKYLLNFMGVNVGNGTKIVGPILINFFSEIKIGEDCWIGKNFTIDGNGEVIIGNNCDIGPNVLISTGGHEIGDNLRRAGKGVTYTSKIESATWVGSNVLILNGSNIGEAAIIAAGAVVIKDVEKNTMVAGVPAKIKRKLDR